MVGLSVGFVAVYAGGRDPLGKVGKESVAMIGGFAITGQQMQNLPSECVIGLVFATAMWAASVTISAVRQGALYKAKETVTLSSNCGCSLNVLSCISAERTISGIHGCVRRRGGCGRCVHESAFWS